MATSSLLIWKVTGSPKWLPLPPKLFVFLKLRFSSLTQLTPTEFLKNPTFWPPIILLKIFSFTDLGSYLDSPNIPFTSRLVTGQRFFAYRSPPSFAQFCGVFQINLVTSYRNGKYLDSFSWLFGIFLSRPLVPNTSRDSYTISGFFRIFGIKCHLFLFLRKNWFFLSSLLVPFFV